MILATERILENQEYEKNFYVDNEKLFCDFCQGTALDHTKKNALDKHLKSKKHVNNVEKKRKNNERELMLRKSPKQEDIPFKKEDIPFEKTNIPFEKADIPFEKVDKPKNFFQEYCANGDAIANSSLLQEIQGKCLSIAFNMENSWVQEWLRNKRISIIVDETTDYYGQLMFNVFFVCGGQTNLASTEYPNIANNIPIAELVVKTLNYYNVSFDNVVFFIPNNSRYTLQVFQVLSPLLPRLKNNRCLVQILKSVGESWIYYKNFKFLTYIVLSIETSFIECPALEGRWNNLLNSLNFHNIDPNYNQNYNQYYGNLVLPLNHDLISWFKFIFWIDHHISQLRTFYIEEEMINPESKAIQELATVFKDPTKFFIFETFIMFVASNAKCIVDGYEYFKIKNKPIAPFVIRCLAYLEATLQLGSTYSVSDELKVKFIENNVEPKPYTKMFHEAFQIASNTLKGQIDNHLALPMFNAVQCFDPRFIRTHCYNINSYSEIEEFKNPENNILEEWEVYCSLEEEFGNDELDLDNYWKNKTEMLPNLSRLALDYIWLPVSGL
ncbi:CGG triplet repeat-binding protein 1 [Rhizophagus irregularis DAOM 181602=DAOM 197198]|uniref:DUF659 domain-containing protein n=2 Tax=Rhizophagus irregularis TaxID=588596 RepID=A0A015M8P1_RHIIW|nr:hypothetical protein GLOIN_2v1761741 [Rhizophagus irregularis DAOM 181602=DAOM 197198]EXX63193.1 hypothetical protein RirG_154630 [Rhizophagus irregularis DAOM 197198w]POG82818.1 hypothetical protein GLOIN_2v1761741 [Rhizophagus irregularis DAOM 181602=DAOM 197198]GET51466.1 CGG triplet repeat-binding protein 1 [Rhizophagus irregularis DAOM 181602=DAOM 197198]|eukprot:XP_025189684.1 hypothetical protein GLOIN_2v1761741 [Rhizophagus irregularis DAOM 181602=DAOM 197198]